MLWNVQNVKACCFVMRKKIYLAKRYSVQHAFSKEPVSVSVLNATVNGNRKVFLIIGSANQNNVLVSQISKYKIKFCKNVELKLSMKNTLCLLKERALSARPWLSMLVAATKWHVRLIIVKRFFAGFAYMMLWASSINWHALWRLFNQ